MNLVCDLYSKPIHIDNGADSESINSLLEEIAEEGLNIFSMGTVTIDLKDVSSFTIYEDEDAPILILLNNKSIYLVEKTLKTERILKTFVGTDYVFMFRFSLITVTLLILWFLIHLVY